jgi:hypothetical protein
MREPVANLSDPGVLLRLRRSVWMFGLSLTATALMATFEVRPLWFLALAVPFFLTFHLSFQALFKT